MTMKKVSEKSLFSIVGSIKQHSLFIFLTTIVAVINLFFSFSSLWNKLNGYVIFWLVFSIIIISALLYKLVDVWNKYQIYNKFANNVHSFMKDTVLTDVEFLSKLEKEDDRFVSAPIQDFLPELTEENLLKEFEIFSKKYSSWSKEYFKAIFDEELERLIKEFLGSEAEITLQLLTKEYKYNQENYYYDSFVEKKRKSIKNSSPRMLNDTMEALIHFKENKTTYMIRNDYTVLIPLTTINMHNETPTIFGFVSFTFQYKIKDFPIKFNLLIDCLIAKCEDICYYIKTLGNSYTLFYVKLYSLVKNAKGPKEEYIEKVSNMLTEMDFLECIFKDFSTGVNEDV